MLLAIAAVLELACTPPANKASSVYAAHGASSAGLFPSSRA